LLLSEADTGLDRSEQYDVAKANKCCQRPPIHMDIFHFGLPGTHTVPLIGLLRRRDSRA
jgi:hypothetical protein